MGPGRRKRMGGDHGSGKAQPDVGREGRNPLAEPPHARPRRAPPASLRSPPSPASAVSDAKRRPRCPLARLLAAPHAPPPASLRSPPAPASAVPTPEPAEPLAGRAAPRRAPPTSLHSPPMPCSPPPLMHRRTWSGWSRGGFLLGFHSGLLFVSQMDWLRRASGQVGKWEPDASGRDQCASGKTVRPMITGSYEHAAHPSLSFR
jgi:hypothetical protein